MSINNKNEFTFITWMQMIGCTLVILGHSYPFITEIPVWALQLREFIYIFHMPLFVWCSGYLLVATNQTGKYTAYKYMKHRAIHILIPYFTFSFIGIIPKMLFSSVLNDKLHVNELIRAFLVPREGIWGHFWFLPMIFFLNLIGYGIVKLFIVKKDKNIISALFLLIGILGYFAPSITGWFSLNDIVHYFVYLVLGILCAKRSIHIKEKVNTFMYIFMIGLSILLYKIIGYNNIVSLFISILMIYSIMIVSKQLSKKIFIDRTSVFAQTYSIFILSWPIQLILEVILERVLRFEFPVIFICEFIAGASIPLLIKKLVELIEKNTKIKLFSFIIGK